MNKNLVKNIWAVVVGFFAVFVLSVGTDVLMSYIGVFPDLMDTAAFTDSMYAFSLAYACAYTVLGGYLTARLSASNPMRQVFILGGIGFVFSVLGAFVNWDKAVGHEWFCIAMIITGPIFVYLGGKIYLKK